jgi:hypothetical protein
VGNSQTNDLLITVGFVVLAIVIIYDVIIRNLKAMDFLRNLLTKNAPAVRVGAAT